MSWQRRCRSCSCQPPTSPNSPRQGEGQERSILSGPDRATRRWMNPMTGCSGGRGMAAERSISELFTRGEAAPAQGGRAGSCCNVAKPHLCEAPKGTGRPFNIMTSYAGQRSVGYQVGRLGPLRVTRHYVTWPQGPLEGRLGWQRRHGRLADAVRCNSAPTRAQPVLTLDEASDRRQKRQWSGTAQPGAGLARLQTALGIGSRCKPRDRRNSGQTSSGRSGNSCR